MIRRLLQSAIQQALTRHAVVALLGPRQAGKTTLARAIAGQTNALYLDLEADEDRRKLEDPRLYLEAQAGKLVVLDEIQRVPGLFRTLRGLVDAGRRRGNGLGQFLVLGSASHELLEQSSESLAGRIRYLELGPFGALEVPPGTLDRLWLRGGFPLSFLSGDDASSFEWREAFLRTYVERDIPQLGPRIPAETLRRFWTMLAHAQAGPFNASRLAASLGVSGQTVTRYLDLFCDVMLVRRLPPWSENLGKRLVRSPKVFVRDSGLVHTLLGIRDADALAGHPMSGPSWEAFVIEMLIQAAPTGTDAYFYRTARGAEIDLLLVLPGDDRIAIEVKRSLAPKAERGFFEACQDLKPRRRLLVYPGTEVYPAPHGVEVIGLLDAVRSIAAVGSTDGNGG